MGRLWKVECADALDWLKRQPTRSVSLVLFSPEYEEQRTYGLDRSKKRVGQAWVDWLCPIVVESARVSDGLVIVNASGPVRQHSYSPTIEWLVADLTRLDGLVCGPSPYCWWKVCGIPGSGSKHSGYHRRDWEPLYALCLPDRLPLTWHDQTAFGYPPACAPGGEFSNRMTNGDRVNDPWKTASRGGANCSGRNKDGTKKQGMKRGHTFRVPTLEGDVMREQFYESPVLVNPGNVIEGRVGGGHMGHASAHRSEAPMCLDVAERFVCWYVKPGGKVADPFCGSGTTGHAAIMHGREFVGCDIRQSQVDLTNKRLETVTPPLPGMIANAEQPDLFATVPDSDD